MWLNVASTDPCACNADCTWETDMGTSVRYRLTCSHSHPKALTATVVESRQCGCSGIGPTAGPGRLAAEVRGSDPSPPHSFLIRSAL